MAKETNLHEKLWASAQRLRVNSSLKLKEEYDPLFVLSGLGRGKIGYIKF